MAGRENRDIGGTLCSKRGPYHYGLLSILYTMPEVPITIEAGPYHIYVKDTALLELISSSITITGDSGGTEGVDPHLKHEETLIFAECTISQLKTAPLRTLLRGGKPSVHCRCGTLNSPTFIRAFGDNARGIVCAGTNRPASIV